jgi:hypothetical protein
VEKEHQVPDQYKDYDMNKIWDLLEKHNILHSKIDDMSLTHTLAFAIVALLFFVFPYSTQKHYRKNIFFYLFA